MKRHYNFTAKEWEAWIGELSPEGANGYTKTQWAKWYESWDKFQKNLDTRLKEEQERRKMASSSVPPPPPPPDPRGPPASDPAPGLPAPGSGGGPASHSGGPASGQPASGSGGGQASDSGGRASGQPASGEPASGSGGPAPPLARPLVVTSGDRKTRREQRACARTAARKEGIPAPRTVSEASQLAPPQICNRVVGEWKGETLQCECWKWPSWLKTVEQRDIGTAVPIESYNTIDGKTVQKTSPQVYWRPGEQGKRWWYNGKIHSAFRIKFPTGEDRNIVAVN